MRKFMPVYEDDQRAFEDLYESLMEAVRGLQDFREIFQEDNKLYAIVDKPVSLIEQATNDLGRAVDEFNQVTTERDEDSRSQLGE